MRIILDISGGPDDVHVDAVGGQTAASASETAAVDGGAGPDAAGPDGNGSATSDVGPPPDWLLEAVGAAERAGRQISPPTSSADLDGTGAIDAGAGPVAEPHSDGT